MPDCTEENLPQEVTELSKLVGELDERLFQIESKVNKLADEFSTLSRQHDQLDHREARNYRRTDHRLSKVEEELTKQQQNYQRTDGKFTIVEEELSELRSAVSDLRRGETQNAADDMAAAYLVEEDGNAYMDDEEPADGASNGSTSLQKEDATKEDTMEDMAVNSAESTDGKGVDDTAVNSAESTDGSNGANQDATVEEMTTNTITGTTDTSPHTNDTTNGDTIKFVFKVSNVKWSGDSIVWEHSASGKVFKNAAGWFLVS
jgi:hypothetical protein